MSARSVDAVRSLLESLRQDLGESRCTQYYTSLRQRGIETHADLLALNDSKLLAAGVSALSHRKLVLARVETLKLLPNPEEALLEWAQGARSGGALNIPRQKGILSKGWPAEGRLRSRPEAVDLTLLLFCK